MTRYRVPRYRVSLLDRLADKVLVGDGCWQWIGAQNGAGGGYGVIWMNGRLAKAHRVLYELMVGPIPEALTLDHLCRNRLCVRPDHLEPVTKRENDRRGHQARNGKRSRSWVPA